MIGGVFDGARYISFRVQQRVQRRLKHLNTLPTLPQVVLRIMKVIGDEYSGSVLRTLNLGEAGLERLRERYRGSMREEIEELFDRCTQD